MAPRASLVRGWELVVGTTTLGRRVSAAAGGAAGVWAAWSLPRVTMAVMVVVGRTMIWVTVTRGTRVTRGWRGSTRVMVMMLGSLSVWEAWRNRGSHFRDGMARGSDGVMSPECAGWDAV